MKETNRALALPIPSSFYQYRERIPGINRSSELFGMILQAVDALSKEYSFIKDFRKYRMIFPKK